MCLCGSFVPVFLQTKIKKGVLQTDTPFLVNQKLIYAFDFSSTLFLKENTSF